MSCDHILAMGGIRTKLAIVHSLLAIYTTIKIRLQLLPFQIWTKYLRNTCKNHWEDIYFIISCCSSWSG
jgi:hypothetical protein